MTVGGWVMMVISWGIILGMTSYCMVIFLKNMK